MTTEQAPLERHMTATGFLVWEGRVLVHWHRKNRLWLPFGGHIEANEDPVQCVLREVEEECGIPAELLGPAASYPFTEPVQLAPPITILLERVTDGMQPHEHIDLIYFCRPRAGAAPDVFSDPTMRWLGSEQLEANAPTAPFTGAEPAAVPEDVRLLALDAIRQAAVV
jgi:8-oxo-dGTP diphosphatase